MIKSITNFLIIFFIFQQLKSQISQIDQNGVKPFCDETLQMFRADSHIPCPKCPWIHFFRQMRIGAGSMGMQTWLWVRDGTVEPRYNEVLGTMKMTLLYQVSHYIRVKKQRNIKSWDQQNYLVIRGFCYIRPLYNEVPLYIRFLIISG